MNFHPDDFLALIEEVEEQGGAHLSGEVHKPTHFRLNQPVDEDKPQGPMVNKRLDTTGCHRRAQFLVPLLPDAYFMDEPHLGRNVGVTNIDREGNVSTRVATSEDFDFNDEENPLSMMGDGETPALVKACAVDDAMGLWPRYAHTMTTGESFETPLGE